MNPPSSRPKPPPFGNDDRAYWYFYTRYDELGAEDPLAFLLSRLLRILTSVKDHFTPTRYLGGLGALLAVKTQSGFWINFDWHAFRTSANELRVLLQMAADNLRERGRPMLSRLRVAGATRIAFPRDGDMVEEAVSRVNRGPWEGTDWEPYFPYLDEIIHFSAGDTYFQELLEIAVHTTNDIWYHKWPGVEDNLARKVAHANRDRLRDILRTVRSILPDAEIVHQATSYAQVGVTTTEDGFSA
jgi:hypothetical protein